MCGDIIRIGGAANNIYSLSRLDGKAALSAPYVFGIFSGERKVKAAMWSCKLEKRGEYKWGL